jgi:hypothetical protein
MSTGFRLFLLVLAGFGAIWVYRLRRAELSIWAGKTPPGQLRPSAMDGGRSPVERVILLADQEVELRIRGIQEPPAPPRAPEPWAPSLEFSPWTRVYADPPGSPPAERWEEAAGEDAPDAWPPGDGVAEASPEEAVVFEEEAEPAEEEVIYEIESGDSLWKIAERQLGSGRRFQEIARLNAGALGGSDVVRPGQRLRLPRR